MRTIEGTTEASGINFPYVATVPESLAEAVEVMPGDEDAVLSQIVSKWDQDAKQGRKNPVREAIAAAQEAGFSEEEIQAAVDHGEANGSEELSAVLEAVEAAQEYAAEFVLGATQRTGGPTKKARRGLGEALTEGMSEAEIREFAREHGLDPADLGL